jgi:chromosome segregation ATPase
MTQPELFFNFSAFNSAVYATIGAVFVGGLVKLINKLVDGKKDRLEEHTTLRKELREELDVVKKELLRLQSELDEWKSKYYTQVELTNELKLDILRLTDELNDYKRATTTDL